MEEMAWLKRSVSSWLLYVYGVEFYFIFSISLSCVNVQTVNLCRKRRCASPFGSLWSSASSLDVTFM